ncbi:cofactor-independent phosphoglycerate mutase [Candidatus Oleimmundimicrobium sp.]|uniref:cofactor-independent phosphoglycerate mutase n=1 Tax=Candidatus Oleimmundimicrobium sp. TaxID=3060597 RepID=UPI002721B52E|nr:cofactor-independent phosphoglycerate mutase [Candidatus Oleimmundimicrobium sp.]MDO8886099.1 cofactor-independent phosphoglycerate mutase [Candidatus Oleimmundimicrobium sp.]
MKYVFLVPDGAADYPLEKLDGKTPLQVAKKPNMDFIAKNGITGMVKTVPDGMKPGSDVANLSLLGYDPKKYYTGRGPLEAANMEIYLEQDEVAFRCNLITASDDILVDYGAGHISSEEARILIQALNEGLGNKGLSFYPGISYRHLMVTKGDYSRTLCIPPHDITGQSINKNLPKGENSSLLRKLMVSSREILENHEVNIRRKKMGKNPANMIWLWGQGIAPSMPAFSEKYGLAGGVVSAVDLIKGIGRCIRLKVIDVPGATGYFDTDYLAKANYALYALKKLDFIFVHVEAPDEAGHSGDIEAKIEAIEQFDSKVVGTILEGLKDFDYKIIVAPDHPTPISIKTHVADPVPFAIYQAGIKPDGVEVFDESVAKLSLLRVDEGYRLMDLFLKR